MRRTARRTSRRTSRRVARRQDTLYGAEPMPPEPVEYAPPPAPAPAPVAPAEDPYEELKKLGELHAQGILTDEEFAAQKAKILGS
jgi:hypothetical protein